MKALELEEQIQKLKRQLLSSSNIEQQIEDINKDLHTILTPRQFQVFVYIIEGQTSKEIAEKLNVASRTVDSHIEEILNKLNIEKRSQMGSAYLKMIENKFGVNSLLAD
jgi:DNA-binding NarL/FixJ family response regulator